MITSPQNRKIKDIRRLLRSKGEHAVLEGPHLVQEALAAGLELESAVATPAFLASATGRELRERLAAPPIEVADAVLAALADADSPRGVLAVAALPRAGAAALPVRRSGIYVLAEALQEPGNLGALARVAEAAGAAGLFLTRGSAHPNHPRALRASAGSLLRLPVAIDVEVGEVEERLAAIHPRWVALVPRGGVELHGALLERALVLMVGSEGAGLSPALAARADLRLTIPLEPPVESLNATVAAAVVLFEVRRRRAG
ncbi:MAG TPA: RNA methyltransferase, partial [Thermoanaerobaculia bacterium]|nr:RNA methyltransferase [Thermoanaerobaculia bacterium]